MKTNEKIGQNHPDQNKQHALLSAAHVFPGNEKKKIGKVNVGCILVRMRQVTCVHFRALFSFQRLQYPATERPLIGHGTLLRHRRRPLFHRVYPVLAARLLLELNTSALYMIARMNLAAEVEAAGHLSTRLPTPPPDGMGWVEEHLEAEDRVSGTSIGWHHEKSVEGLVSEIGSCAVLHQGSTDCTRKYDSGDVICVETDRRRH